jgi:putative hydrolase of the HAD superfamily
MENKIKALFLDVGGVLLTNGWDHHSREEASKLFNLDLPEFNVRHALTFDTYETGKISLDTYLDRVIFYEKRGFSREAFKEFMFAQSKPHPEMIAWIQEVKSKFNLKVVVVSNEGRELMDHRIRSFKMKEFVDFFVCSAYVHFRKPDLDILHLALDCSQVAPDEVIYIDDRVMLAEIAEKVGLHAIHHTSLEETKKLLYKIIKA